MADTIFLSWRRLAGNAIGAVPVAGRPVGTLTVDARDSAGGEATADVHFALHGPGDVVGLRPGAVTARFPRPGQTDAEDAYCPYVEFAATDLPWRYSPRGVAAGEMQSWLSLLAVKPSEIDRSGGAITVSAVALSDHVQAPSLAHVQVTGGHELSRVVCMRPLTGEAEYVALLVPAFDADGDPRWDGSRAETLPVYDEWWFRTGEPGTFETLAKQLRAADQLAGFGRISVALGGGIDERVAVRGGLTGIHDTTDPPPPPAAAARLQDLLAFDPDSGLPGVQPGFDADGRRYVRPPDYGEAWLAQVLVGAPAGGWVGQVNDDPTHRVVAGLGLQAGVDLQDEIAGAAADRFGATSIANQRLAALGAGLAVGRSLWDRRLKSSRVTVLGLAAGRVIADQGGKLQPLLELATGPGRTLPAALFSSAARRILRPGSARLRYAKPDATRILDAANQPRPTVRRPDDAPGDPRYHDGVANGDALVAAVSALPGGFHVGAQVLTRGDDLLKTLADGQKMDTSKRFQAGVERIRHLSPERPAPRPLDLVAFEDALVRAFDPRRDPAASARVRATIVPDDPEPLAPREPCVDLDLPAWRYLRDRQREWLLPGASTLEDGEVVGLASNPVFADAFLLGMNTQALGELRWRNLPFATGCTPLRRFWDGSAVDGAGTYAAASDIVGINNWVAVAPDGSDRRSAPLGDPSHTPAGQANRQLVVAFCTDLFRRYPGTLVYLAPPTGAWDNADLTQRTLPSFTAMISPKLVLFAFPIPPEQLEQYWVVVEQQPPGTRFLRSSGGGATTALRSANMLVAPVRVLLEGPMLAGGV
jgi:hypothetical protein